MLERLLDAHIRVWVITGDKQETAVAIATSCKLFSNPERRLMCNAQGADATRATLRQLASQIDSLTAGGDLGGIELVVDGKTLTYVLSEEALVMELASLGERCSAVVVCRASPS